jgi:hypothetical protein
MKPCTWFALLGMLALTSVSFAREPSKLENEQNQLQNGAVPSQGQQPEDSTGTAQEKMGQAQTPENKPAESPDEPEHVTLPAGTVIEIRIADEVDSSHNHYGDLITGTVDPSVLVHDHVVIPRGTEAHVRMLEDKKGGHLRGKAEVKLELVSLVMNGQRLGVDTETYKKNKGALSAKAQAEIRPSAGAAADTATAASPGGSVADQVIGVFRAAKVDLKAGKRIPFTLTSPFTFDEPPVANVQPR